MSRDYDWEKTGRSIYSRLTRRNFLYLIIAIVILNCLWSSWYVNRSEYNAVEQVLGRYYRTTGGGPHLIAPWPIGSYTKVPVLRSMRVTVGFIDEKDESGEEKTVPAENEVLTSDLNIILLDFVIQYRISDPTLWLYTARDPEGAIKDNGQAAMRLVCGGRSVDEAMTTGRSLVQTEAEVKLQETLDKMNIGVKITKILLQDVHPPKEVADAFKDVNTALEEKISKINNAQGHRNQVLPDARGEASRQIEDAKAYAAERIAYASGDVARFEKNLEEYSKAPGVTKKRMQLEALESILAGKSQKVMDVSGILNFNNLNKE